MKLRYRINGLLFHLLSRTRLRRLLSACSFSIAVNHKSFNFVLPIQNGLGYSLAKPSPNWVRNLYSKLLPIGNGIFMDIGCNFGQTFLQYLEHRNPSLSYVGVDPIASCTTYLRKLALKNDVSDAIIITTALGSDFGIAEMRCVGRDDVSDTEMSTLEGSLSGDSNYLSRSIVPVVTGDAIIDQVSHSRQIHFIKIDVEGFELAVLSGLSETIRTHRPIVLCEVMFSNHPDPEMRRLRRSQVSATNELLGSLGYRIYHAKHDSTFLRLDGIPLKDWDQKDQNDYDFLFIPLEREGDISFLFGAK